MRLANTLIGFWRIRGHLAEGREWLARLLDAAPIDGPTRERARGLRAAALLALPQGDHAAGERLPQESLALYREIDDPNGTARAFDVLVWVAIQQEHYPEAEPLAREAIDRARAVLDRRLLYSSLGNLAVVLHQQGQLGAARELYEQALAVAREFGTPFEIGRALAKSGRQNTMRDVNDLALKHFAEGMTLLHGLGNRPGVIESLEGLAGVAAATAAPLRAARLWGAVNDLRQEIGNARPVRESVTYERQVKMVRATLTAEAFDQAWDEGRAISLDDAVRYASDDQAGRDN